MGELKKQQGSRLLERATDVFGAPEVNFLSRAVSLVETRGGHEQGMGFRAALLLLDQGADVQAVAAALLAPLLWEGRITVGELGEVISGEVSSLLDDLYSPLVTRHHTGESQKGEMQRLLSAMSASPQKALILIGFRTLALEAARASPSPAAQQLAMETTDIYVPIANLLGLGDLRRRLEDASFRILDPQGYADLRARVAPIQAEDDKCLEILVQGIKQLLEKNRINCRVQGRTKSLHAIRRKMIRTGRGLEEIMDRIGLRIIVTTVPECYSILGLLHTHFKPIPGTFDDYIGLPKDNGYQSLHTCVYPVREISEKPIEIQVRTELMHMEAEYGTAAHWRYKREGEEGEQYRSQWLQGLAQQHESAKSTKDFVKLLHRQVFQDHLVIFGNGGRIVRLPDDATVRDYLNRTNTRLRTGGTVKVNGRKAALDQLLKDGDTVEVEFEGAFLLGRGNGTQREEIFEPPA